MDPQFNIAPLIQECRTLQENALYTATSHFVSSTIAWTAHLILGAFPIVLGGIGSWPLLTDPNSASSNAAFLAGAFTLTAGIVGSILSFWNLAKVRLDHFTAAVKYKTLENEARRAFQIHAHDEPYDDFKKRVMDIARRYDELGESSPQCSDFAFWCARKRIGRGLYKTQVDAKPNGV